MTIPAMNAPVSSTRFVATSRFYWIAFLVIIAVFACAKLPDLSTPYFWDEMGVYAPGSLYMKDHSISLMPASLDSYYSRGHPLLCYAAYGSVFKIFGDSVLVGHSFSLLIAIAVLLAVFLFAKEIFSTKTALISVALLCIQPVFYTMSAIIMPEMLVTFFLVISIWAIIANRWWVYILAGSLAMLTKEATIVLPVSTFIFLLMEAIIQKDFFSASRWRKMFCAIIPLFVFAAFLIIQKKQNGWYFFPLHIGMTNHNPLQFIPRFFRLVHFPLFDQGRWLLGLSAIVGVIVAVLFPYKKNSQTRAIHLFTVLFVVAMMFSAMNYFLPRYIVFLVPFIVLGGVHFAVSFFENSWPHLQRVLLPFFIVIIFISGCKNLDPQRWADNWDMSYQHQVFCQKQCINWAEQQPWHDSLVETNFPVFQALSDKRNGYLQKRSWHYSVNWETRACYGLFYHIDGHLPEIKADSFIVLKQFQDAYATCSVLKFYYKK